MCVQLPSTSASSGAWCFGGTDRLPSPRPSETKWVSNNGAAAVQTSHLTSCSGKHLPNTCHHRLQAGTPLTLGRTTQCSKSSIPALSSEFHWHLQQVLESPASSSILLAVSYSVCRAVTARSWLIHGDESESHDSNLTASCAPPTDPGYPFRRDAVFCSTHKPEKAVVHGDVWLCLMKDLILLSCNNDKQTECKAPGGVFRLNLRGNTQLVFAVTFNETCDPLWCQRFVQ